MHLVEGRYIVELFKKKFASKGPRRYMVQNTAILEVVFINTPCGKRNTIMFYNGEN